MKNKKERLQLIVNLVKKNSIGSQNELAQMLEKNGCRVTQATLSRDLKSMKITKVATNDGGYMYIIPDTNKIHDSMLMSGQRSMTAHQQVGFISIKFSGNIAVIKTRTIAGADTVFAIMDENLSHDDALKFFARFIPVEHE